MYYIKHIVEKYKCVSQPVQMIIDHSNNWTGLLMTQGVKRSRKFRNNTPEHPFLQLAETYSYSVS